MAKYVIELECVTVEKSNNLLLDNINLNIFQGELVGIIGPNGAGKTTLLNVIAGFERFDGKLFLFGQKESWKRNRRTRLRIAYVPQLFEVDRAFPIRAIEVVMMGFAGHTGFFCSYGKDERDRAIQIMEMMRISNIAMRPFGLLSGGERQKVLLARAILQQPDILLLDEPTSNLDVAIQKEVMNLIDEIHRDKNLAILLVTHDFNLLPASLHRAVLLKGGRKIFDGDIDNALSNEVLTKLFQYPLETFEHNGKRFISYD